MQLNIYAEVAPLLREQKFNIDIDAFLAHLNKYNSGNWIFPNVVHRETKIDVITIYEVLDFLAKKGYLEEYLRINCPNCQQYSGFDFKSVGDVPDYLSCMNCDYEITNPLKNAIVIFKVK